LEKVGLLVAEGVVVVFAAFVVGEGEFAALVWFLGEVELEGIVVAGVGIFAVCDFAAPAISMFDPASA